jgi:hypothetical protein
MASRYSPAFKFTALLLVLSIAQVYVLADSGKALFGLLATSGNSIVNVNGGDATSGATILSGVQLQTPENVTAHVQLSSLGKLDISPNTSLTLDFDESSINVNVTAGDALLTTNKGINGSITFKDTTERTDPTKEIFTVSAGSKPQGVGNAGNSGPSFGHMFEIGFPIIFGSILMAVYVPCRRGRNPSPGTPRGRNDECRRGF